MLISLDNGIGDSSMVSSKLSNKEFDGFKELVLANKSLSNVIAFYKNAKAKGFKPIIGLQAEIGGVVYILIAHNHKGYVELCEGESYGFKDDIFASDNVTAIACDITETSATIKSKYGSLRNEVTTLDTIKNIRIQSSTYVLPVKVANMNSRDDLYTMAYLKSIENRSIYEDEIAWANVYGVALQKSEVFQDPEWRKIVDGCVDDYSFGNPTPPEYKFKNEIIKNATDDEILESLAKKGLEKRLSESGLASGYTAKDYANRLDYELSVIKQMKFSGYFLIVWDFVNWAKQQGIPVGPGRGSAAGSLVTYCLTITNLDPIRYNLLFERFLNPERVSFPDIDIDFCQEGRDRVIDYVTKRYGQNNVAQVITFGTLAAKASIRDAGRVLNMPLALADKLAKIVPATPGITLAEVSEMGAMQEALDNDFEAQRVWDAAVKLEGKKRSNGVHASGLVISNDPIPKKAPLYWVNDAHVVGVEGNYLEDVDLVKFDFLGLKTLTVCNNAVKNIKAQKGIDVNLEKLKFDDEKVFSYISQGHTVGMFQIESLGMQDLAMRLKPHNFEELIAMIALYRPGPKEAGLLDSFINRKQGLEEVNYFFNDMAEVLKPILEPTYGVIVYQEQVMQIVQVIGGFTMGEADLVRRAMGKKKPEEMAKLRGEFVNGAVSKGYPAKEAEELFSLIEKFAGYGFNKSHSAAYAVVSYYTAWLKVYYPTFFMAALINSDIDKTDSMVAYVNEAKRMGIKVLNPDFRFGGDFTVVGDKEITFGLRAVKGVGASAEALQDVVVFLGDKLNELSLSQFLNITQKDSDKDVERLEKQIERLNQRLTKNTQDVKKQKERIEKLLSKESRTAREETTLQNNQNKVVELQSVANQINDELSALNNELIRAKRISHISNAKLNKTALEALFQVGAFDKFGHTRKDLFENAVLMANPANHKKVKFTNEEYSLAEKIQIEMDRVGVILSPLFSQEELEEINKLSIPEENPVGVLIGKDTKVTKNGKEYFALQVFLPNGKILSGSDFNGVAKTAEVGRVYSFTTRTNGNYLNFTSVNPFEITADADLSNMNVTQNIQVFDDIKNTNLSANSLDVYDINGNLIATFIK